MSLDIAKAGAEIGENFVKTAKGFDEVNHRQFGLTFKERQILILINGKRDFHELCSALNCDASATIERLLALQLIRPLATAASAESGQEQATKRPKLPRPESESDRFAMARNFMLNTLNAFVGIACSSLLTRIEAAENMQSLRQFFGPWREAIRLSSDGRKALLDLEEKLAALLS